MAEIKWIKITTDIFEDEKIDFIDSLPEKDTILIIWIKLLTLAGKVNDQGIIYLTPEIPYTEEMLAHKFKRPVNTVRLAFSTFVKLHLIEILENGNISIINWEKHQNIQQMSYIKEQNKIRKQRQRGKQKLIENKQENDMSRRCHINVTLQNKNKNKNKNKEKILSEAYTPDNIPYRLSSFLFNEILKHNPNSRLQSFNNGNKEKTIQRWAKDINLLICVDHQEPSIVEEVIRYCTADGFWGANILSGSKLREKWDTLAAQMKNRSVSRASKSEKESAEDDTVVGADGFPLKVLR